jgi:hypothetical protein
VDGTELNVPLPVRLRFGHAAVQYLADSIGVELLHIKGAAVDASLRPAGHSGSDVDVIVRPKHLAALDRAMRQHGWHLYSTFENGSPFGHAQTYLHDAWGYVDLHRFFPGIRLEPGRAFDVLWRDRHEIDLAGVGCRVPSIPGQAVLLMLNAARASGPRRDDLKVWTDATEERRAEMTELVTRLHADVAFAAATGDLERFRGEREYRLWKVVSEGGSRSEEWWARIRAAPTLWRRLRIAARAPLVNVDHLAHRLGRRPTFLDVLREFFRRAVLGVRETVRRVPRVGAKR